MIELSTDENEIKAIILRTRISHYLHKEVYQKLQKGEFRPATSKSGSSQKETKNAENNIKSEADIKSNSNYSSTSALNTPLF